MERVVLYAFAGTLSLVVLFSAAATGVVTAVFGGSVGPGGCGAASTEGPAGLTGQQSCNAGMIVRAGRSMAVPRRALVIAVATALQESRLRNLAGGDRDSVGLFQQRPSQGWGARAQLRDPAYASRQFFRKLLTVAGWQRMQVAEAAQAVQRSAYPDAYAAHKTRAETIVAACLKGRCGSADSGWTRPASGPVVSGFRPPSRPGHHGIDFDAERGSTIRATSAGVVAAVVCDSSSGNCDRDGSPSVLGCGWYVDLKHAGGIVTRYCHMLRRPHVRQGQAVAAGQPIGLVGSSGNSSGPHLHLEVHMHGDTSSRGAVNPVSFLRAHGVHL